MVISLTNHLIKMNTQQKEFVEDLVQNLDPYLPFLEQKNEKAQKWLKWLYGKHIEGKDDQW